MSRMYQTLLTSPDKLAFSSIFVDVFEHAFMTLHCEFRSLVVEYDSMIHYRRNIIAQVVA